jgi:hypothetical protein
MRYVAEYFLQSSSLWMFKTNHLKLTNIPFRSWQTSNRHYKSGSEIVKHNQLLLYISVGTFVKLQQTTRKGLNNVLTDTDMIFTFLSILFRHQKSLPINNLRFLLFNWRNIFTPKSSITSFPIQVVKHSLQFVFTQRQYVTCGKCYLNI